MSFTNNTYYNLFNKQKTNQYSVANTTYKQRIKKLNVLKKALEFTYRDKLKEALIKDLKRHPSEVDLLDIYPTISEIKLAKKNIKQWMKKQRVETPLFLIGSSSWYQYEPKGVCLIISPFNFPYLLTFGPLVSAISAGNTVIIKPSELTPNCSGVMQQIVEELYTEDEVAIVQGKVETLTELLKSPFNHIFFTGSPTVGKIIMKAASENLTSVTLELGGKSPVIIDETAHLKSTVKRIAWGKFFNSGQACIAPDYIMISESIKDKFLNLLEDQIKVFYGSNASKSNSFSRIVNENSFNRIKNLIEDAKSKGATIVSGGNYNSEDNYIEPTIITEVPDDAKILHHEIFGPVLPVLTYKNIDEAIRYINSKEKPLALYIYSQDKKQINHVLKNTRAGSSGINNNVVQFGNHNLPFGGSNTSGIGKSHGFFGFQEFSNMRSVLKQNFKGPSEIVFPPYNKTKQKIIELTIKWF